MADGYPINIGGHPPYDALRHHLQPIDIVLFS